MSSFLKVFKALNNLKELIPELESMPSMFFIVIEFISLKKP